MIQWQPRKHPSIRFIETAISGCVFFVALGGSVAFAAQVTAWLGERF